jgi:membrane fusion protein (multidrug efflux system)
MLHDPETVWVTANIKETDIRHIEPGAPVVIKADSAPSADIKGRVARVNETTLAEASMMPNPNANGVFTKITQRIKVKIEIDPTDVHLRSGTMVTAKIRKQRASTKPTSPAE